MLPFFCTPLQLAATQFVTRAKISENTRKTPMKYEKNPYEKSVLYEKNPYEKSFLCEKNPYENQSQGKEVGQTLETYRDENITTTC